MQGCWLAHALALLKFPLSLVTALIPLQNKIEVYSFERMGIPDSTAAFPLSRLGDACLRKDLTAIDEILEKLRYKDDEGAATEGLHIPTIAVIEGATLGGGLEMALCCDLQICGEDAKMALPETGLAIIPGAGGTQRLPRLIGKSKAKELIYTGQKIYGRDIDSNDFSNDSQELIIQLVLGFDSNDFDSN